MEEDVQNDAMALLVELRRLRLDLVTWVNRLLVESGTNLPQYTLMEKVDEMGEVNMSVLAERLAVTMGAATNLVDRLVHAGHVERRRSESDRRVVKVELTEQGRNLLYRITNDTATLLAELLQDVSPGDRRTAIAVIRTLADRVASRIGENRR